jgi:hypothetical protein
MIATSPSSSTRPATTMSKAARSSSLWVGNATHWLSIRATLTPPIGPAKGTPAIWVDIDAALIAQRRRGARGEREDRLDNLDLVAQTLGERRAQRPVDQAAGQDRILTGSTFSAEERAGDAAGGVHPLLDVHGEREEVELLLRLTRYGRGGEDHGLVVE